MNNIVDLNLTNNFLNINKDLITNDISKSIFINDKAQIIYNSIRNNIIKVCSKEDVVKLTKTKAYTFSKILLQNTLKLKFTVENNLFGILKPKDQLTNNGSCDYSFPSICMNEIVVNIFNIVSLLLSEDKELLKSIKNVGLCKNFDDILPLIKTKEIINDKDEKIINSKFSAKFIANSELSDDNKYNILDGYKCSFFYKKNEVQINNRNELDKFLPKGSSFNILVTPSQLMNYPAFHKNKANIVWKIELIQITQKPKTNEIDPKKYLEDIDDEEINEKNSFNEEKEKINKNINNISLDDFEDEEQIVVDDDKNSECSDEENLNNLTKPPSLNKKLIN